MPNLLALNSKQYFDCQDFCKIKKSKNYFTSSTKKEIAKKKNIRVQQINGFYFKYFTNESALKCIFVGFGTFREKVGNIYT